MALEPWKLFAFLIEILAQELYNGYGSCSEGTGNAEVEFLSDEYFTELNTLFNKTKKENNKWGIFGGGKKLQQMQY